MSENGDKSISITDRTKAFAIRIIKACSFLDEKPGVCRTLSKQLLRSGTSIGANVHESRSAQSDKDFLHKMEIALKEAQNKSQLESRKSQVRLEVLNFNGVAKKVAYLNFKLLILIVSNLRLATCDLRLQLSTG